jgi:selenide,water dikinase
LGPADLAQVLKTIPRQKDRRLLVGLQTLDDAGIYKIGRNLAIVQTVDFFPPVVDDPYDFGMIAAANALSDVYAMGGTPLTAMSIVCFPSETKSIGILAKILKGGTDKLREAGTVLVGGHSVKDSELKFGFSVTGTVDPGSIVSNAGAKPGDALILTKPIGTGILTTALKMGILPEKDKRRVTRVMSSLNWVPSRLMRKFRANACTDVTGFGLGGHAWEMARASKVTFRFDSGKVPLLPGVRGFVERKSVPGGTFANRDFLERDVSIRCSPEVLSPLIVFDPQTSGGLLISIDGKRADRLLKELWKNGIKDAAIIGEVVRRKKAIVEVL